MEEVEGTLLCVGAGWILIMIQYLPYFGLLIYLSTIVSCKAGINGSKHVLLLALPLFALL